jgi:hypothetical protein
MKADPDHVRRALINASGAALLSNFCRSAALRRKQQKGATRPRSQSDRATAGQFHR